MQPLHPLTLAITSPSTARLDHLVLHAVGSLERRRVRPPGADVAVRCEPGIVCVSGEVDIATVATFRAALDRCDADPSVHALDLSEVTFFSAAGANAFVDAGWRHRPHVIVIASAPVRRVLALTDLTFLLDAHGWDDHVAG